MFNMYISLGEILNHDFFREAKVLCGRNGLTHTVKQISVFDCLYHPHLIEQGILQQGDLFITCLDQFTNETSHTPDNLTAFFDALINAKCAGLIILGEDSHHKISTDIILSCNNASFPIIYLPSTFSYSLVMNTVNQYLSIDNYNAFNKLKIDKILLGNSNTAENLDLLYSIKPSVSAYVQAVSVTGEFNSSFSRNELYLKLLHQDESICIIDSNRTMIILSAENRNKLSQKTNAMISLMKNYIHVKYTGFSRVYQRHDIREALTECSIALQTAIAMKIESQIYGPLSSMQLLLSLRGAKSADDFYQKYVETISRHVSSGSVSEILHTIETFVAYSGDYQAVADQLSQHINTIRYRINKVKEALGMEYDTIKFYETIAIASKLRTILNKEI